MGRMMTSLAVRRMLAVGAAACGVSACAHPAVSPSTAATVTTADASEGVLRADSASRATARFAEQFDALGDACAAADWSAAALALREARESWRTLAPMEARIAVPTSYLDTFWPNLRRAEQAVMHQAQRPCASEAYGLRFGAIKLRELMDPSATGVERLRTWMRRVDLDAHYRDWQAAARDIARAEESLRRLGPPDISAEARATIEAAFAACHGATEERASRALRHATHAVLDQLSESQAGHGAEWARASIPPR